MVGHAACIRSKYGRAVKAALPLPQGGRQQAQLPITDQLRRVTGGVGATRIKRAHESCRDHAVMEVEDGNGL